MEKTSGCLWRSETFLVFGLLGALERKAMTESGSERAKKMKLLRFFFVREWRILGVVKEFQRED